jgi:multidrug efflux pump subunit AcrA (membrane-fusion protein)
MSKRQNRPWYLYVLAVVAVAIAVLAVAQIGPPTSSARTSTQIVTAGNGIVQSTVSGSGNVEAGADLNVNFQTSGTLSNVYVKAGQHVTKGQLLATLDSTAAQLSLDQAEQNLTAAEDQLSTAQTNAATSTTSSTASTASLNTSSGSGTTEFVSNTTTVPTTTTTTPATTTTQTTTTTPKPTTQTTPTTTKPATTAPTAPTTSGAATSGGGGSTGSASTGSGSSGSGNSTSTTSPAGTVASAQAAVYSAEASVTSAQTALAATKLYAPISGTIVSLANLAPGDSVSAGSTSSASTSSTSSSGSGSSTSGGAGTTAGGLGGSSSSSSSTSGGSSSPFAEIVNTSTMTMTVAFSESDISKVKVGQPATVTLDALTGVELGAHVSAISTVGTTSSSVVSYNATLTLDQTDSRVKPGMSASASVVVAQAQGVNVPNSAVSGTGSIATVTLVRNGKQTQQQVAVGLRGDNRTQIVSGLNAGDQLAVTTTLPPLTSGTSTT